MAAAAAGAKEVPGSLTVGILPRDDATVSPDIDLVIQTDLGNARNNLNVLSSQAVLACGVEGAGTASEVALALKAGRPVVLVRATEAARRFFAELDTQGLYQAATPGAAVAILRDRLRIEPGPAWNAVGP